MKGTIAVSRSDLIDLLFLLPYPDPFQRVKRDKDENIIYDIGKLYFIICFFAQVDFH